jgi:hypothetical protein
MNVLEDAHGARSVVEVDLVEQFRQSALLSLEDCNLSRHLVKCRHFAERRRRKEAKDLKPWGFCRRDPSTPLRGKSEGN